MNQMVFHFGVHAAYQSSLDMDDDRKANRSHNIKKCTIPFVKEPVVYEMSWSHDYT